MHSVGVEAITCIKYTFKYIAFTIHQPSSDSMLTL